MWMDILYIFISVQTLENQISKLGKELNKKSKYDYNIRKMLSREEQKSGNSVIKYKKEKEKQMKQIDHATLTSLFFFFLFGFVFFLLDF